MLARALLSAAGACGGYGNGAKVARDAPTEAVGHDGNTELPFGIRPGARASETEVPKGMWVRQSEVEVPFPER